MIEDIFVLNDEETKKAIVQDEEVELYVNATLKSYHIPGKN